MTEAGENSKRCGGVVDLNVYPGHVWLLYIYEIVIVYIYIVLYMYVALLMFCWFVVNIIATHVTIYYLFISCIGKQLKHYLYTHGNVQDRDVEFLMNCKSYRNFRSWFKGGILVRSKMEEIRLKKLAAKRQKMKDEISAEKRILKEKEAARQEILKMKNDRLREQEKAERASLDGGSQQGDDEGGQVAGTSLDGLSVDDDSGAGAGAGEGGGRSASASDNDSDASVLSSSSESDTDISIDEDALLLTGDPSRVNTAEGGKHNDTEDDDDPLAFIRSKTLCEQRLYLRDAVLQWRLQNLKKCWEKFARLLTMYRKCIKSDIGEPDLYTNRSKLTSLEVDSIMGYMKLIEIVEVGVMQCSVCAV